MTKKYFTAIKLLLVFFCLPFVSNAQNNDSTQLMKPVAFDWNMIKAVPTKTGEKRQFFNSTTATLDNLECHVTTLNPGESAHLPHQHPEEEMTIVKEGTVEVLVDGKLQTVGPGSVVFQAANQLHSIKNVGTTQATYFAIKWKSAKTGIAVK
ncbi:MAG TPA: cupin domain-containing protein [Chitinophagaceae bacterium]